MATARIVCDFEPGISTLPCRRDDLQCNFMTKRMDLDGVAGRRRWPLRRLRREDTGPKDSLSIPFQGHVLQISHAMRMLGGNRFVTANREPPYTMAHLHRFHVSREEISADRISLPEAESHHALRVARVRLGDRVALFDGEGREAIGEVAEVRPDAVTVSVETRREKPRALRPLTLAQAWLNREKSIEPIISRGTELCSTRSSKRTSPSCLALSSQLRDDRRRALRVL